MELAVFFHHAFAKTDGEAKLADPTDRSPTVSTPAIAQEAAQTGDRLGNIDALDALALAESPVVAPSDPQTSHNRSSKPNPVAKTDRQVIVNRAVSVAIAASTAVGTFYAIPAPATGSGYSYYVEDVQGLLASRGFYDGSIDGVQGRLTVDAIIQAQQFYGLDVDGVAGSNTIAALSSDDYRVGNTSNVCNNLCTSATVAEVQALLQQRGFYNGAIDGIEGSQTVDAIIHAQQFYGVGVDGIVGPVTMAALEAGSSTIVIGGYSINQIQTLLQQRGFYNGAIDGIAGPLTKNAIIRAQQFYGLVVDGIAGPATVGALQGNATSLPNQPNPNQPLPGTNLTVQQLQTLLQQRGFYNGAIDGAQGPATTDAIIRAQRFYGLTADGIAGSETIAALQRSTGQNPNQPTTTLPGGITLAQLQALLQQRGFYTGPVDGVMGAATTAAIVQAQQLYGLPANGIANAATIAALQTNNRPATNPVDSDTVALQKLLTERGFYTGSIDGVYGTSTRAAVIAAQRFYGLTADGIVGPGTIAALQKDATPTPTPTPTPQPTNTDIVALQELLKQRGFYNGAIDGKLGAETNTAIIRAKNFYGLQPADGMPTETLINELLQDPFTAAE